MASLNSLGLGSDGVLSYDIIDQLREVDESGHVKPIETKIASNTTKTSDLSILTTMAASFKTSASVLSDEMTYLSRTSSTSGSSASVTVESGSAVQDFSVNVKNLATRDIYQSKSYLNETSTFASGDDTLTIGTGTDSFSVDVTTTTTLTDLKDLINDNSDGKVIASILNVGGDNPYKLIIKSTDTGKDNAISFSSTANTALGDLGLDTNSYVAGTPLGSYGSDDTLTFNVNGTDYSINALSTDTITEINTKIQNLGLGSELTSTIENGVLVLDSNDPNISVSGLSASTFGLNNLTKESGNVQQASDSLFLYNGVTINRSSNAIDDLIAGVSIKLNSIGSTSVDIKQDTEQITSNISSFISTYNDLMSNLNESTKYDSAANASGSFQGVSQIVTLKTIINKNLMTPDSKGRSIADYGISLNRNGILELDQEVYNAKLAEDPADMEEFFRGYTDTTTDEDVDGYFTLLNSTMADYIEGDNSVLGLYKTQLSNENKTLESQKTKAIASLDNKYAIMAKKFAAYDSIISNLNSQFSSLSTIIKQSYSTSN